LRIAHLRIGYFLAAWLVGAIILASLGPALAQEERAAVYVAEVRGVISPPVVNYLARVFAEAEAANASLIVIKMDTPGGLESSMREIIQDILDSPVPVAVYVSPPGGRAASAGLFILMAGHIAAMAPNTNTGSAHPVAGGGEEIDEVMTAKVVNDAAALIRSLASMRGRNAVWAEQAVRESVSVTEQEALDLNVIDVVAANLDDLIAQIDGQTVATMTDEITLNVSGAPQHEAPMNLIEQFLHVILSPNLAFILLTVGSIGIIAELYNPGALIPGITGVMSLILAFFALGTLPTNWAGVALIVMAVILYVAELNTETTGVLAVGGTVAFVLGGLILFRPFQPQSPVLPELAVSPWLIGVSTAGVAGFMLLVIGRVVATRKSPLLTGHEHYIGQIAQVRHELHPDGRVWFQGQSWFARSESGQEIEIGKEVRIVGLEGLTLLVEPLKTDDLPGGE
jgi:membrane-bound serine protease (ClpP class)